LPGGREAGQEVRLEGRPDHHAPGHHLLGQLEVHAARDLQRPRSRDRHHAILLPLEIYGREPDQGSAGTGRPLPPRPPPSAPTPAPDRSAEIPKATDPTFKGATAETLTESERAFQLSFISMVSAVISAPQVVSVFVLVIVALILGNTIAMSVRERGAEVAILKALGFTGGRLAALITGESALIGALGGLCGVALAVPIIHGFGQFIEANLGSFFPVFDLDRPTTLAMLGLSVAVGLLAALLPAARVAQLAVVDAMRRVG